MLLGYINISKCWIHNRFFVISTIGTTPKTTKNSFPHSPPTADLYTDTDFVRSYVPDLVSQGKHIIVLMNSYGGQVGTNALAEFAVSTRKSQGLSGGVVHLLYISAFMMSEGESMMDKVRLFGHEELIPVVFIIAEDGTHVLSDPRTLLIGSNPDDKVTEAEIEEYISNLSRWNGIAIYQPLKDRAAWRDIETSNVITKMDMIVFGFSSEYAGGG
ncbi:hypothetical protein BOTNAR_0448g00020 [Botryotinia narcissicola]|uniref:AB hydrolase-1 domain-containing protein n=1 Tax=Botryotinia narcissicola TaxID=278944 RepID=A0A4Z1HIX9_9HELO|nr:hypothetical protein BOTNAR_0448g00020 [Botryotinia narcissicola]